MYAVVTALLFRNLLPDLTTHLYSDLGDPLLNTTILAWFGVASILRRYPRYAPLIVGALAVCIVAEGWHADRTRAVPRPMRRGAIPSDALVLDLPIEGGFRNALPQYRAVIGGYRTINGYRGYQLPHFQPFRRDLADLVPDALAPYRRLRDLYVIVRSDLQVERARWIAEQPGAELLFELGEARIYHLPRVASGASIQPVPLPLPTPGDRPFWPSVMSR